MLQYYLGMSQSEIDKMDDSTWAEKLAQLEHIRTKEAQSNSI